MVGMLMRKQDLSHLFRLVSHGLEGIHVTAYINSCKGQRFGIGHLHGRSCRESGINQYHLGACIYKVILQTAAITDVDVIILRAILAAKSKRLAVEPVLRNFTALISIVLNNWL